MSSPEDTRASLDLRTDPGSRSTMREEQRKQLHRARARSVMVFHGIEDPRLETALVTMASWAEGLAAAERVAEHDDEAVWVSTVFRKHETKQRTSHLALLGAVIFVLGILCGVVLAALRLR
ncbi:hypothetical protein WME91_15815 [Sorangium sp. So ce269]